MYRKIMRALECWKQQSNRKPLVVHGAKQVGKTYSVLEFGRQNYENIVYMNFKTNPENQAVFHEQMDIHVLIDALSKASKKTIEQEKTIIILDEIELCEAALCALQCFHEHGNAYHVVAISALLDVARFRGHITFPSEHVDMITMYPMDMEEFMLALGEETLVNQIRINYESLTPLSSLLHDTAMHIYRQYLIVGGMPSSVLHFASTKDYILTRHIQDTILLECNDTIASYHTNSEIKKARITFANVVDQLSKKNKRFQYRLLTKGNRLSGYIQAMDWLEFAGFISRVYKIENTQKPLVEQRNIDFFRAYYVDVGLLCARKNHPASEILYVMEELQGFEGGLVENYVHLQLKINGNTSYFWRSERGAEIDFVVELEGEAIPVEVKTSDNTKAKSLRVYMELCNPIYVIKLSSKNFDIQGNKRIVPLYAAFCI